MIKIEKISQSFRGKIIFDDLEWAIKKSRKYGLIGPNGAGKTTLLETVCGSFKVETGNVTMPRNLIVGYLPQELEYELSDTSVVDETVKVLADSIDSDEVLESYKYKAEKILMGLGFTVKMFEEKTAKLSGGWKMRIELAKILLKQPDLLLLDEPTNHLDIESIGWLEDYLHNFNGTVVIVSHDKYLLDRMIDTVAELHKGKITEFTGSYSDYLEEKERIREVELATYKNQQKKIMQTERFIERFRYKNTKASQVQSRVKMLEKMEIADEPEAERKAISLKFPEASRSGKIVYEISEFSKQYDSENGVKTVFTKSGPLKIERDDKIALAGRNGGGKTTLVKIINGIEKFEGDHKLGHNVELSYYAQNQTDMLNLENTVYEELLSVAPDMSETKIRSVLGSFLFNSEDLDKKVKVLSGGEKSRVALSKMLVSPSNFLVLDEPTNHLDMQSKEVLLEALKSYNGTFIIISHDRYFIDQLVNRVWYVENKGIRTHLGNYSSYIEKYKINDGIEETHNKLKTDVEVENNSIKKIQAEERNKLYRELQENGIENMENWKSLTENQLGKALQELEERIFNIENKKEELTALFEDPEFFNDKENAIIKNNEFRQLEEKLKVMYERWDDVTEYIDSISN